MEIEIARTFAATAEEVHAALVDPQLQAAKAAALSALDHGYDRRCDGDLLEVVTWRRLATTRLPEFVRSLVPTSMTVVETERWEPPAADGSRDAEFRLDIEGAPVRLRGFTHLQAGADGDPGVSCRLTWCGRLEATVPFFRARITESASASVTETIEVEFGLIERALGAPGRDSARGRAASHP